MSRLWLRLIKKHRIEKQDTCPCLWGEEKDALTELCHQFDVPVPIWLGKQEHEWEDFRRTAFTQDQFVEEIHFDRMEIEFLDDTGKKRVSRDPRNDFST